MSLGFKDTKEFNEVWEMFVEEMGQQKWKMPKVRLNDEKGSRYFQTERFRWCAQSMMMWLEYKKAYLNRSNS